MQVAQQISQSFGSAFGLSSGPLMLSASVGVAYAPAGEITAEELLKRADRAMRRSKDEGHGLPVLEKT